MTPNLFGNSAALFLEATLHANVSKRKKQSAQPAQVQPNNSVQPKATQRPRYKWRIVWRNVVAFLYLHIGALYGVYLIFAGARFYTFLFNVALAISAAVGITGGAHRLWCHRSYKAKWPMRLILMIFQTVAFQNHLYEWVRDHRVHHKFTDTDADPHNAKRGFFFSHIGWLLLRKHPDVIEKGKLVDMSDLDKDPIVVWQRRLYIVLMPLCCFFIPTWIPCRYWGESAMISWYLTILRYTGSLNLTWLVNSAAHIWGTKPYDRAISATDNIKIAIGAFGEGWHNYHHVFPWDYKAAELGNYKANFTTGFIDFFARIGWAYDLKTVPLELVEKRAARTGDGTRMPQDSHDHSVYENAVWGWDDSDMQLEDIEGTRIEQKSD